MNKIYSTDWQRISMRQVVPVNQADVEKTGDLVERIRFQVIKITVVG